MDTYYGEPVGRLENEFVQVDYLTEAGPRVVRLIPKATGQNLLAETPDYVLPSVHGEYRLRGGHRMWHAPEASARTYVPDDAGLAATIVQDGVKLTYDEPHTGIEKQLLLKLHPTEAHVQLYHRYINRNAWAVELAPWAITQLPVGGTAVLPQHTEQLDPEGLLANRHLVLWQYSSLQDPRLKLGDEAIRIETAPLPQPFKLGYLNRAGWLEYRTEEWIFRKSFRPEPDAPHADMGCNTEIYTNDRHIELETLGPLVTLQPGGQVEHAEFWELFPAGE